MKVNPRFLGVLALVLSACGDDGSSPLTNGQLSSASVSASESGANPGTASASNSGSTSGSTSTSGEPSTDASDTSDPTTAAPTSSSTGDDPTGGGSTGGKDVCDRYIQCVAVTTPNELPAAQQGFGDDSACWSGDADDAALCVQACQTALKQAHQAFPAEEKCHACLTNDECDAGAGEKCLLGGCAAHVCGDGVVDDDELCDGQVGCSADCKGGGDCSPLNNFGCFDGEICSPKVYWCEHPSEYEAYVSGPGEFCGYGLFQQLFMCGPGLECVPKADTGLNCDGDTCCTRLCDVNAPAPCPMNLKCVSYSKYWGSVTIHPFEYVGVCVL